MKKKVLCVLFAAALMISTIACGGGGTDSTSDTKNVTGSAENQKDDEDVAKENATEQDDNSLGTTEVGEAEPIEPTEEQIQDFYATIKETVTKEYLEPNNIAPEDFEWPSADSDAYWYMTVNLFYNYCYLSLNVPEIYDTAYMYEMYADIDEKDREIMKAVFNGMIAWYGKYYDPSDRAGFNTISDAFDLPKDIVFNITFSE